MRGPKPNFFLHGQPGEQRPIDRLEHPAALAVRAGDGLGHRGHPAFGRKGCARHQLEQGGFARSAGPDRDKELALGDGQRQLGQDQLAAAPLAGIGHADPVKSDRFGEKGCHAPPALLRQLDVGGNRLGQAGFVDRGIKCDRGLDHCQGEIGDIGKPWRMSSVSVSSKVFSCSNLNTFSAGALVFFAIIAAASSGGLAIVAWRRPPRAQHGHDCVTVGLGKAGVGTDIGRLAQLGLAVICPDAIAGGRAGLLHTVGPDIGAIQPTRFRRCDNFDQVGERHQFIFGGHQPLAFQIFHRHQMRRGAAGNADPFAFQVGIGLDRVGHDRLVPAGFRRKDRRKDGQLARLHAQRGGRIQPDPDIGIAGQRAVQRLEIGGWRHG